MLSVATDRETWSQSTPRRAFLIPRVESINWVILGSKADEKTGEGGK